jgi:hypothetical protein
MAGSIHAPDEGGEPKISTPRLPFKRQRRHVEPSTVTSPRRVVADLAVLYDGGLLTEGDPWSGWSVARMTWAGDPDAVGIRWNGEQGENPGNPSSRGYPTWLIIPAPLAQILVDAVNNLPRDGQPPNRLRRSVNELLAAARAATPEEMTRLQLAF